MLHTEYASVAGPIVAFIDQLRDHRDKQIVVLIPVPLPDRLRYQFLHNHFDLVLSPPCAPARTWSAPGFPFPCT